MDKNATTGSRRATEMPRGPLRNCHGGEGALDWTEVLAPADLAGRRLRFVHDDRVPPGVTIGEHTHTNDEEYYYILEGSGEMLLDGRTTAVSAGDIAAVFPGGRHGLRNTGGETMRVLVFSVAAP